MTFLTSVFAHEGNPCTVTTDNGTQLTSSAFSDFLNEQGIKHIKTSVCVEHFNTVLKDAIQAAQATHRPWKHVVTEMLHSYRATPHANTGKSHFQLLRGKPMWTKLKILPSPKDNGQYTHVSLRVAQQQATSACYTLKKKGAKTPKVSALTIVRLHKPFHERCSTVNPCAATDGMQRARELWVR